MFAWSIRLRVQGGQPLGELSPHETHQARVHLAALGHGLCAQLTQVHAFLEFERGENRSRGLANLDNLGGAGQRCPLQDANGIDEA